MAIFNRKKKNSDTLPEVEQYYTAERRERAGLAWVLAVASILVVALIIVGLFFGGRWLYRTLVENDTSPEVTSSDNGGTSVDGPANDSGNGSTSTDNSSDSGNGSTDNSSGNSTKDNSSGSTAKPNTGSGSSSTTTPSTPSSTSPAPAPSPTASSGLPNTGPGNTVALFAVTATTAAAGHLIYHKRKASR